MGKKESAEKAVRDIRRKTRRRFSAEEKIPIVIEGLRGEESIASLCRREGIAANLYYRWSKEFLEAGKRRLQLTGPRSAPHRAVVGSGTHPGASACSGAEPAAEAPLRWAAWDHPAGADEDSR
jgi:transposase